MFVDLLAGLSRRLSRIFFEYLIISQVKFLHTNYSVALGRVKRKCLTFTLFFFLSINLLLHFFSGAREEPNFQHKPFANGHDTSRDSRQYTSRIQICMHKILRYFATYVSSYLLDDVAVLMLSWKGSGIKILTACDGLALVCALLLGEPVCKQFPNWIFVTRVWNRLSDAASLRIRLACTQRTPNNNWIESCRLADDLPHKTRTANVAIQGVANQFPAHASWLS